MVAAQDVAAEVVVLDSQVTDAIARADFTHGGAGNRLMELTHGNHVAFLTQDAEPASPDWLRALLDGFGDGVGLVCGPYLPRPGTNAVVRRELEDWFARMRDGGYTAADLGDPPAPGPATFASSANLCLSREAWHAVPFRDVAYAEDQRLVLDLLRAGWAKVFTPRAAVLHSHRYGLGDQLRRWFDEFRGLHDVYGWLAPAHPRTIVGTVRARVARDGARSAPYHLGREATAAVVIRAERLPAVRRRLSLEGRA